VALTIASSLPYHVGYDGQRHYWQVRDAPDGRYMPIHGWDGVDGRIEWREFGKAYRSRDDAIERARSYALYIAKKH